MRVKSVLCEHLAAFSFLKNSQRFFRFFALSLSRSLVCHQKGMTFRPFPRVCMCARSPEKSSSSMAKWGSSESLLYLPCSAAAAAAAAPKTPKTGELMLSALHFISIPILKPGRVSGFPCWVRYTFCWWRMKY